MQAISTLLLYLSFDLIYGFIVGALFLLFGYIKFRLRWLFHFIVASLGLIMLSLLFTGRSDILNFLGSVLIIAVFCILVVITGFEIYHSGSDVQTEGDTS